MPDTNDYIRVRESTTTVQLAADTPPVSGTADFDTVDDNTDGANFSLASEAVVVALAGEYLIEYKLTLRVSTTTATTIRAVIEIDPNTASFAEALETAGYLSGQADNWMTIVGSTQRTLVASSKIRLALSRIIGNQLTEIDKNSTLIMVTRLRA